MGKEGAEDEGTERKEKAQDIIGASGRQHTVMCIAGMSYNTVTDSGRKGKERPSQREGPVRESDTEVSGCQSVCKGAPDRLY